MSAENVQIVRQWIDASNDGEVEMALGYLDPGIEWTTTGRYLEAGTYRGHEGVRRYLESLTSEFDGFRVEPEELIDAGELVVFLVRVTGRGRRSRVPVDLRMTVVASLRDGKIARVRNYPEKPEALEAAGLSE